jgi:hypothetical protein
MIYTQFIANRTFSVRENAKNGSTALSPCEKMPKMAQRSFLGARNCQKRLGGTFSARETPAKSKTELFSCQKP